MKIVFMGTPDFSVPALEEIAKEHDVIAVVTKEDKPKGRGHKMQFTPVKEKALELNIPVYQPAKVKDEEFVQVLRELNPDVIVVIAFGQILSKEILDLPKYGCINVHASLLPEYRGAAPIQWAVIDGKEKSGVTTMYMGEGLDTGDIIEIKEVVLDETETGGSLFDKLSIEGSKLILSTLKKIENNTANPIPQDDSKSTYAGKITRETGLIDFNKEAKSIECLIRGVNPWPSAYTYLDGKMLKIWKGQVVESDTEATPGTIIQLDKKNLIVKTKDKAIKILEVQLEGKKRMDIVSFLNGNDIKATFLGKLS